VCFTPLIKTAKYSELLSPFCVSEYLRQTPNSPDTFKNGGIYGGIFNFIKVKIYINKRFQGIL
jgi:hypothetical protein